MDLTRDLILMRLVLLQVRTMEVSSHVYEIYFLKFNIIPN